MNKKEFDKIYYDSIKELKPKLLSDFEKTVNEVLEKRNQTESVYAAIFIESIKYSNSVLYSILSKCLINED